MTLKIPDHLDGESNHGHNKLSDSSRGPALFPRQNSHRSCISTMSGTFRGRSKLRINLSLKTDVGIAVPADI